MFHWNQADPNRLSEPLIAGFQDALLSCNSSLVPIEDSLYVEICHLIFLSSPYFISLNYRSLSSCVPGTRLNQTAFQNPSS